MKELGFGFMRLPLLAGAAPGNRIDTEQSSRMVDRFLASGFTYFDTAHGYMDEESERALRICLTERHPRQSYQIADKLTVNYFKSEEDIRPFFENQLQWTGVEYFDYYLLHCLTNVTFEKFKRCRAFDVLSKLKEEGKIRRLGLSFHDKAALLERILMEWPEIEFVQIQFNYLDYDSPSIESGPVYDVCRRFNKEIIVMEPVRGGHLADLPDAARSVFEKLGDASSASYAIRYAAGFDGVTKVLSGMSNLEQMEENIRCLRDFVPLSERELEAIATVREILKAQESIPCTNCRYCTAGCPEHIDIPSLFSCLNSKRLLNDMSSTYYYATHSKSGGKASSCIGCGECERACPQHLAIRKLLGEVAAVFE